ncbi:hypothetical protein QYF61_004851 [Mycteria americana]|uniref:SRCR domain-containing protein n=1 Tax=Mycteria americana TaxID=33587 RepID=A0AAN7MJL1_MYCAM|nr:hypothetical protein QYF61_004851 [Mycteria americana]
MFEGAAEVRLANGDSRCAGRVEVKHQGQWGTVCDDSWGMKDAAVVCKQLGCGSALEAHDKAYFGAGSGPIWMTNVGCRGTESALSDCRHRGWGQHYCDHSEDAGVTCSGFVQLVRGDSPCSGRVEIHDGNQWKTVCDSDFGPKAADVVCRELQCGTALSISGAAHFGEGVSAMWDRELQCVGNESFLMFCPRGSHKDQPCTHANAAGVTCTQYTGFRLGNGSTACEGRVEVEVLGTWGTLCASRWDLSDAHVLCRHLNCGFAESIPRGGRFGRGPGPVWRDSFHCNGTEAHLGQCPVTALGASPCSQESNAAVICSGPDSSSSLRLVGGGSRCDGRVEILQHGTWGRVLDDQWDMQEASVVCRQLQCGEAEAAYNPPKPERGTGPVGLRGVRCAGHEARLTLCNTSVPESALAAGIAEDVGVVCWGSRQVRLVNGPGRCAGRVEIYYQGSWGTVCDDGWDLPDATVVCHQLGCGGAAQAVGSAHFGKGSGWIWLQGVNCSGAEAALWDCPAGSWGQDNCGHKEDAGVVGSEFVALRLENSSNCSGRLQVFYNGTWGSVCSNSMTPKTVSLACKELGCGDGGYLEPYPTYGRLPGHAWLDRVQCGERNSSFWQCPSAPWDPWSCDDLRDETHITCNGNPHPPSHKHHPSSCSLLGIVKRRDTARRGFSFACQTLVLLGAQTGFQLSEPHTFTSSCQLGSQQHPWEAEVSPGKVSEEPSQGSEEHSEKIRAVGGENGCSGRVEIWHGGSWGTVCDDSWDMQDAAVACRQLGCGPAVSALDEAAFGEGTGPIWLEQVECRGTEPSLQDCWARPGDSGACQHKEDAAVRCSAPHLSRNRCCPFCAPIMQIPPQAVRAAAGESHCPLSSASSWEPFSACSWPSWLGKCESPGLGAEAPRELGSLSLTPCMRRSLTARHGKRRRGSEAQVGSYSEGSLTKLQPYPGDSKEEDGPGPAPGCLFSLSPAPLSFQTSLSCPEVTQRMAMMMPGRFLTLGRILPLGRETGKSPGCQRREQGPGMHPEVRGKDSTAGSWGATPAASELLPY